MLGPLATLHAPVPTEGVFAASTAKEPVEQMVWLLPATDVVGFLLKVTVVVLDEEAHGALLMVHCNVYVVPAVPENVDVGLDEFPKDPPLPLTILQLPVPALGELPASVTVVTPQVDKPVCGGPAFAVVGVGLTVIVTYEDEGEQGA